MTTPGPSKPRHVRYIAPSDEAMREFAYKVCAAMAESEDDSSYLDWKIVDGFARFLIVVAKAQAEYLSNDFEPPDENPVDKQVAPE